MKFLSYNAELLYCATDSEIEICKVELHEFELQSTLDAATMTVRKIVPGVKIHGLILNQFALEDKFQLVAYETKDNILDFNRLFIENFDDNDSYKYRYT